MHWAAGFCASSGASMRDGEARSGVSAVAATGVFSLMDAAAGDTTAANSVSAMAVDAKLRETDICQIPPVAPRSGGDTGGAVSAHAFLACVREGRIRFRSPWDQPALAGCKVHCRAPSLRT